MFSKLTEGIQSKLMDLLLSPAAFFWLAGLFAWFDAHPALLASVLARIKKFEDPQVFATSLVLLVVVMFSAAAYEPFNYWVLDRLAGYWGALDFVLDPLRGFMRSRRRTIALRYQAVQKLKEAADAGATDTGYSSEENSDLERALNYFPAESKCAPTRFGCALVASDSRITKKYGLAADVCWPALSLVISETGRSAVAAAQAAVEASGRLIFWTLAAFVWVPLLPTWPHRIAAIVALLSVLVFAEVQLTARGREYAGVFENAFAVGRFSLYKSLRLKLPETFADEPAAGKALVDFLFRGVTKGTLAYEGDPA